MVPAITDYAERAVARLKAQFSDSAEFKGLVTALALECQALDTALFDTLETFRDPNLCVTRSKSSTLAKLSDMVGGRDRGSLSDAQFRDLILAQIQTSKSDGTVDELVAIYDPILSTAMGDIVGINQPEDAGSFVGDFAGGDNCTVLIPELAAAQFGSLEQIRNAMSLLKQATPAGNRTVLIVAVDPTNNTNPIFLLDSTNTDGTARLLTAFDAPDTVR